MHAESRKPKMNFINGVDPVAAYLEDIKESKKLTMAEEKILAKKIHQGDKEALGLLVRANLKFVVAVSHNYEHQGLPMADLINEGNLGLIEAARRFDETRNFRFISYAVWWIRQTILNALARQSRNICVSPSATGTMHRINKAARRLTQRLGRQPSPEELELETGLRAERIKECLDLDHRLLSLNHPYGEDGRLQDSLADESETRTERILEAGEAKRTLEDLMQRLDAREKEVLRLSFGIGGGAVLSLADIADRLGISRESIRQIKRRSLAKLRHAMKTEDVLAKGAAWKKT